MTFLMTRRDCLKRSGAAIALSSVAMMRSGLVLAQQPLTDSGLIVRTETPYNAEPALGKLAEHWLTPTPSFFVRSHGTVPRLV
jgi:hypothetical protein